MQACKIKPKQISSKVKQRTKRACRLRDSRTHQPHAINIFYLEFCELLEFLGLLFAKFEVFNHDFFKHFSCTIFLLFSFLDSDDINVRYFGIISEDSKVPEALFFFFHLCCIYAAAVLSRFSRVRLCVTP